MSGTSNKERELSTRQRRDVTGERVGYTIFNFVALLKRSWGTIGERNVRVNIKEVAERNVSADTEAAPDTQGLGLQGRRKERLCGQR